MTEQIFKTKAILTAVRDGVAKTSQRPYTALAGMYENGAQAFILLDDDQKARFSAILEAVRNNNGNAFAKPYDLSFIVSLDYKGNPRFTLKEIK